MADVRPTYLIMITSANNNKYYKMTPKGDEFLVEFGRVGAYPQTKMYSISKWNSIYNSKIKKGYVDQTDLRQDLFVEIKPKNESEYKDIEDNVIAEIVDRLQQMAKKTIAANYRVSSREVTQAMVDKAQELIDNIVINSKNLSVDEFNRLLIELFGVIPRKMHDVNAFLSSKREDFDTIISKEQDLLDVMRGQVVQHIAEDEVEETKNKKSDKTILETMGLVFERVNDNDVDIIKNLLGDCRDRYHNAWKVTNIITQKRFDDFKEKENISDAKMFWHGSRNENWWSIIGNGLMIRPSNAVYTGSMFGDAIYASNMARKSLGYTSINGSYWARGNSSSAFMAVMDTLYGKPYDVYNFDSKFYSYNYKKLQDACPNANCLHAHAGSMLRNDEIVFYNKEQLTIKYLVELK